MEKPIIVCVDDEKSVLNALRDEIKFELGSDFSIEIAENGEEGLALIQDFLAMGVQIPVVVSDQLMPGMKGDEFLTEVFKIAPAIRTILLTGQATAEAVGNAVNNARLYRFISKPWDGKDLTMTIQQAAKSYFLDAELDARIQTLNDINATTSVLAKEIATEPLIEQILKKALLHSDAERGVIFLYKNATSGVCKDQVIQFPTIIEGKFNEEKIIYSELNPCDIENLLPFSLIQHVVHTQKAFTSDKIIRDPQFAEDSFLQKLKAERKTLRAVFASTIQKDTHDSHDDVIGVLYLESTSKSGIFNPLQLEYFEVILRQSAVSLDNALLYQNLESRVEERTAELNEQKELLAQKNEDVTASIRYALRIQSALLPNLDNLSNLFPDSFVYYKPKDIVSGDFYWFQEVSNYFYLAAVDCTGHGVPGAFMSVLASSLLNEIVSHHKVLEVGEILNQLHQGITNNLERSQHGEHLQDGMDIALCRICPITKTLQYAGANRPLIIIRGAETIEIEHNKLSIGYSVTSVGQSQEKKFNQQTIQYQPNDEIYMYTDGVTDQFGGNHNRKFSRKSLQALLRCLTDMPFKERITAFDLILKQWQGNASQTDDILLVGVRLN